MLDFMLIKKSFIPVHRLHPNVRSVSREWLDGRSQCAFERIRRLLNLLLIHQRVFNHPKNRNAVYLASLFSSAIGRPTVTDDDEIEQEIIHCPHMLNAATNNSLARSAFDSLPFLGARPGLNRKWKQLQRNSV